MRAEPEADDMLPEYDFSSAVRGAFAGRWTSEQREELRRASRAASLQAWLDFATARVHGLEAALFTYLILEKPEDVLGESAANLVGARSAGGLGELVVHLRAGPLGEPGLHERLDGLLAEVCWLAHDGRGDAEAGAGERLAHAERLERIGREADALRDAISGQVEQRLLRAGMSRQEIEQKTEETARLWLAA
jgi:hypothetical protein